MSSLREEQYLRRARPRRAVCEALEPPDRVERQMQPLFLAPTAYPARLARYESQLEDSGRDLVEFRFLLSVRDRSLPGDD
jgi:hypothetical protein